MNTDKILANIRSKRQQLNYSQDYVASVLQMKQANELLKDFKAA